jgi:ribonuclease P protein component
MRVGLIVPRYKHSAVARNQLKRRLRELSRLRLLPANLPADVVVRIRPDAYAATFEMLSADITQALTQLTRWSAPAPAAVPLSAVTIMPPEA